MRSTLKRRILALTASVLATSALAGQASQADTPPAGPGISVQPANAEFARPAEAGEFPFAVYLPIGCSGSLIHPEWVLTAAHCVPATGPYSSNLTIGRADLSASGGEVIAADRVVRHADWPDDGDQDLALVHLSSASTAKPIELVSPDRFDEIDISNSGDAMLTLGYGRIADDGSDDDLLRVGNTTIGSIPGVESEAQASYTYANGGELQCRGDSGGPWVVRHHDGTLRQFALSSWSEKNGGKCGSPAHGTSVRARANYDWIVANVYPEGMGNWLSRPVSQSSGQITDPWRGNGWRTGWSIQEFVNIGGKMHIFLYRDDNGEVQIRPMGNDGTPGDAVYEGNWSEGWTSIRPYTIGNRTFLFEMKVSDGTAVIDELKLKNTGEVTVTEQWRENWASGWTAAEPFRAGSASGLFLLEEDTGHVKTFRLRDSAPWVEGKSGDWHTGPLFESNWSAGWSNVRFVMGSGLAQTDLFLMKDTTGEAVLFSMDGFKVAKVLQRTTLPGARWSTAEFHLSSGKMLLTLQERYYGKTYVLDTTLDKNGHRQIGTVVQERNAKNGNTHVKPFCLSTQVYETATLCADVATATPHKQFMWYYREGRI